MSRLPLHALVWSKEQSLYEFYTQGQLQQRFGSTEEAAWLALLRELTSFAFHGAAGSLNVYGEARSRGGPYWYAYHTTRGRTRKRYLGLSAQMTFARLEETAQALASEPAPSPPAASHMPPAAEELVPFSSRLTPPGVPHVLVERERLLSALDGALSTRLSLLAASAGWGKTTLLAAWASRRKEQVAWLSLDELDNSPVRFWVSLIAALRRCETCPPDLGENVVTQLSSPQPPPLAACLSTLLHELEDREAHPAPLVLILDDYHLVTDPAIHESLSFFLEHLPAHLHLILSSRVDPDLPLSRLRAHGQLTEMRADELRFRLEEASHYFGQMLFPLLSAEEVQRLVNRTEGWIVGLQLAALALQKREDRATFLGAFTGSQRYLLDYVREDILARLPADVREFLLQIAILTRLDASVCQAVTASPERRTGQQMLTLLERANLFLIPLDEERRTYRLHDLFREALLAVLHATQPELPPLLHRRAASFYEAQEQWAEAIAQWFEARDFSTAARLMEQTVERFWLRGEAATMVRWILALPEPLVREHARLVLSAALYLLNTVAQTTGEQRERVHQQVRQLMARVETALLPALADETGPSREVKRAGAIEAFPSKNLETPDSEEAVLRRRLGLLRAVMAWYEALATWDVERLSALHQQMQELGQDEEAIWQLLPLFSSFVLHYAIRQEGAVLLPRLLEAKERMSRSGSHFATTRVSQWLAFAAFAAGQLRLAYEECLAGRDLIEQIKGYSLLKGYFESVLAWVLHQWNRLEEARSRLRTVIGDATTWQHSDLLLSGSLSLMQVELARGDLAAVQQALHEFEQLEAYKGYAQHWHWLPAIRAQWWLAQGQVQKASDWAAGVVFPQGAWDDSLYGAFPVVIRVYFAQRRWQGALDLLDRFREHLDRPANIATTIAYLAQSLVALHQTGQRDQARAIAARLFALTEPEGYLRVYLDEGDPMRQALLAWCTSHSGQHPQATSTTAYVSRVLAAFEQEEQQPPAGKESLPAPSRKTFPHSPQQADPHLPIEPLSPQERRVLRLLAAGQTYAEMAETLVVSPNTIKSQVGSIYRKLNVRSRLQAYAAAQRLRLL